MFIYLNDTILFKINYLILCYLMDFLNLFTKIIMFHILFLFFIKLFLNYLLKISQYIIFIYWDLLII